jgi:predicted PurR-regulated permease PerM
MEMLLIILLIAFVAGFIVVIFVLNQKLSHLQSQTGIELLKADLTELGRNVSDLRTNLKDSMSESLEKNNLSMQRQLNQSATNCALMVLSFSSITRL